MYSTKQIKQYNITTDPLADLLYNINKNPEAYTNKQTLNSVTKGKQCIRQTNNKCIQQEAKNRAMDQKGRHQSQGRNR